MNLISTVLNSNLANFHVVLSLHVENLTQTICDANLSNDLKIDAAV